MIEREQGKGLHRCDKNTKNDNTAKINKRTNLGTDTGKHNKSLKESRERPR